LKQANAEGNASDTQRAFKTVGISQRALNSVLPNFISLNEVSHRPFGYGNKIQDLNRARYMSTLPTASLQTLKEEVEIKQKELAKLAKLKGVYDKTVLDRQLILVRSKLFREYATMLISVKPGSQTPGIDKEIYNKEEECTFEDLVKYLRDVTYHPNKYKSAPIKRV
jgi:hypothetical protein